METNEKEVKIHCVRQGMSGLFDMDRNITPPTPTAEDKAREKRKAEYEARRKNKEYE
jgi:4'-phosphopantetheinyl transferase EntD